MEVELISASWCKRCLVIKPDVVSVCKYVGAVLTIVDFDDLEEDDPLKKLVTALPTIRVRDNGGTWSYYTPAAFEDWKALMMSNVKLKMDDDF